MFSFFARNFFYRHLMDGIVTCFALTKNRWFPILMISSIYNNLYKRWSWWLWLLRQLLFYVEVDDTFGETGVVTYRKRRDERKRQRGHKHEHGQEHEQEHEHEYEHGHWCGHGLCTVPKNGEKFMNLLGRKLVQPD